MAQVLCGVCNAEPKKYKCPTCALPYCSLSCFKIHKPTHSTTEPTPSTPAEFSIPQPPPPAPLPRYLKKTDFSVLATNPKFQELLKTQPTLLSSLQRVYANTIQPDPEDEARRRMLERNATNASRGRGGRGGWRGRGGRGGGMRKEERWTPKKGDADAMALLKDMREGNGRDKEKEAMGEFVALVEELFRKPEAKEEAG